VEKAGADEDNEVIRKGQHFRQVRVSTAVS